MHPPRYSVEKQEIIFSDFWNTFSKQIVSNKGVVDFPGSSDLQPHHVTTVVRLPLDISKKLHKELSAVLPSDYHYPVADMHFTLINLDILLGAQRDIDWRALNVCISKEVQKLPQLQFRIRGIGVFPTTVFAQIYDTNSALELYRAAIVKGVEIYLSKETDVTAITALVPGVTFANLIRFKNKPEPSLIKVIDSKRAIDIGSFQPHEFELVTTNRLLSKNGTVINAAIQL